MPTTQFRLYTSEDPQGPGPMRGVVGDVVRILDAVLVQGYGTGSYYKPSAGWSKPASNSGSVYGAYTMASGSKCSLFINDNAAGTRGVQEAWATGWMYATSSCTDPGATAPASMIGASGSVGQFPSTAQAATDGTSPGTIYIRKSATANTTPRSWLIAADAYGLYMWIWSGDYADRCIGWGFGDIYAFRGADDKGRCMIYGPFQYDSHASNAVDALNLGPPYSSGYFSFHPLNFRTYGHYLAASTNGTGGSMWFCKKGDTGAQPSDYHPTWKYYGRQDGYLAADPATNSFFMHPIYVCEPTTAAMRGRYRGLYYPIHTYTFFSNGQIIQGTGDYAGKTFMMVAWGLAYGLWALEISNTVETN